MKKIIAAIVALNMVFAMCSCGYDPEDLRYTVDMSEIYESTKSDFVDWYELTFDVSSDGSNRVMPTMSAEEMLSEITEKVDENSINLKIFRDIGMASAASNYELLTTAEFDDLVDAVNMAMSVNQETEIIGKKLGVDEDLLEEITDDLNHTDTVNHSRKFRNPDDGCQFLISWSVSDDPVNITVKYEIAEEDE